MFKMQTLFGGLINAYLHGLPSFRGKWRLLQWMEPLLRGIPVRSHYGPVQLRLYPGDRTNRHCILGTYNNVVPDEVERLEEGDCFIDVGANCGLFSIMAGQRVGAAGLVLAFEPCQQTFSRLVDNIETNGLKNILPFRLALADMSGIVELDSGSTGHSGRYAIASPSCGEESEPVAAMSMDGFPALTEIIGDRPTTVKIDVEGFELSALRGLTPILVRPATRRIVVEVDDNNLARYGASATALYDHLKDLGFAPTRRRFDEQHFDEVFVRTEESAQQVGEAVVVPFDARRRRAPDNSGRSVARRLPRVAAAMLVLGLGWVASDTWDMLAGGRADAHSRLVHEALVSHQIAKMRSRLYQTSTIPRLDVAGVGWATQINVPKLPRDWRVRDVQILPSDEGLAVQVMVSNGEGEVMSLFAVRADMDAPVNPDVVSEGGDSIAYWQEGDLAYALTGDASEAELDRIAERLASDFSS